MFKRSLLLGGLSALVLLGAPSCSSDKPCEGAETCACYANSTCDTGLDCRSNVCVNLSGAAGAPSSSFDAKACFACAESACASAASACKAASGCDTVTRCLLGCAADATCLANCAQGVTADDIAKSAQYQGCALTACSSDCTYSANGFGGSGNGSAGASSSAGGASKAGNGSTSGGSGSVGGSTGAGGSTATNPVSGTNWLSLSADAAPSTQGVNGKLGIEGVFYAYGDACSTPSMFWDPNIRCISGTMCAADANGVNWGVAIGFDFNNLASVKHAWNATTAGVTGITWKNYNSTNSMQVWIQNMDPSFNGSCSTTNCNINAPPDGVSTASPGSGLFTFANMVKDDWGPSASSYVFNPANVSALQFKVSAQPSPTDYMLCIDALGVIR
ncbi:MAG TPA: hypothetical protein VER04_05270 [Polyangiaceae bacterium]|nr:hypothetical protein [Polyangiaceae bacterium]